MDYSMDPLENKKYDCMDNIVESIYKDCVKIDNSERKILVQRLNNVIENLITIMKQKDRIFNLSFNKIGYTGSFYDNLKVGEADEYDLNLILTPKLKMELSKTGCEPGFIAVKVAEVCQEKEFYVNNWISNGFVSPAKVKRWLEGVIARSVDELRQQVQGCLIQQVIKSGPAMTLKVSSHTYPVKEISIDLVPVMVFPSSQWPFIDRKSKKILNNKYEAPWFAVPKTDEGSCWRISFPLQEREIMGRSQFFKYTIRLIKKVRDELQMKKVSSYYIKTMFLWELEQNDRFIWTQRRGRLFMLMLYRFRECLLNERIPFYWDKKCNLIGNLRKSYLENCYGQLNNFINKIDEHVNSNNTTRLNLYIRGRLYLPVVTQAQSLVWRSQPEDNQPQNNTQCLLQ